MVLEQQTGVLENVEAFPGETVTEVTEITEADIAKEQKVDSETQESIQTLPAPG